MKSSGIILLLVLALISGASTAGAADPSARHESASYADAVAAFITVNAYGNNLYLDNITMGRRFTTDIGLVAITNIKPDTSYSLGSSSTIVSPAVLLVNVGRIPPLASFDVTFTASPGGYTSTRSVPSLPAGQALQIGFDPLTIPSATTMSFVVTLEVAGDQNSANDTLRQTSILLPGVQRMLLLEEWTSSTCGPCAANNPTVDAFITARFDSVLAIKYHVGWPSPGNDPMYLHNPTQSYDRRYYYGVNAVPHVIMDGVVTPSYPYSTPSSLPDAAALRMPVPTPVSVSVTDERIAGDSIRATVAVTVHSPMRAGSYRLRVHAVERHIHYASAPGTNGETDFFDVFRRAYPNSTGTLLPTSVGTHTFVFTYRVDTAVWVDSMVYTAAFVQDDNSREVLNCGKGRMTTVFAAGAAPRSPAVAAAPKDRCIDPSPMPASAGGRGFRAPALAGLYAYELFEGDFPPPGWRLANPNADITLGWYEGVSGPTFGGNGSVMIDFYSYSSTGRTDTLFTRVQGGMSGNDTLTFDWAYAQYPGYSDRLIVRLSTNGGATFPHVLFDRSGATLATAPSTTSPFVPSGASQWQSFSVPLAQYLPPEVMHQQQVSEQWNILSLPMEVYNPGIPALYPGASSAAFRYIPGAGYQSIDSAHSGFGYWLKFPAAQTVTVWGYPVPIDSPQVFTGWNLIGSTSNVVPVSAILTSPPGILASEFYGFGSSGYVPAAQLEPGRGYFVKVNANGRIIIPAPVNR